VTGAWFTTFGRGRTDATRLLCMAGGGAFASEFQHWPAMLAGSADVVAVVLPGRERRIREQGICSMPELVDALAREIEPWLSEPMALFGHSLGALVLFELAVSLRDRFSPLHLFVSAQRGPTVLPPPYLPSSSIRESYCHDVDAPPLTCPVTAFVGDHDSLAGTPAEARAWERETTGPFRMVMVPGRHLFLRTHLSVLTDEIAATLAASVADRVTG